MSTKENTGEKAEPFPLPEGRIFAGVGAKFGDMLLTMAEAGFASERASAPASFIAVSRGSPSFIWGAGASCCETPADIVGTRAGEAGCIFGKIMGNGTATAELDSGCWFVEPGGVSEEGCCWLSSFI